MPDGDGMKLVGVMDFSKAILLKAQEKSNLNIIYLSLALLVVGYVDYLFFNTKKG